MRIKTTEQKGQVGAQEKGKWMAVRRQEVSGR